MDNFDKISANCLRTVLLVGRSPSHFQLGNLKSGGVVIRSLEYYEHGRLPRPPGQRRIVKRVNAEVSTFLPIQALTTAGESHTSFISHVFLLAAGNIYEILISDQFHCIFEIMTVSGVALRIDCRQFRHSLSIKVLADKINIEVSMKVTLYEFSLIKRLILTLIRLDVKVLLPPLPFFYTISNNFQGLFRIFLPGSGACFQQFLCLN